MQTQQNARLHRPRRTPSAPAQASPTPPVTMAFVNTREELETLRASRPELFLALAEARRAMDQVLRDSTAGSGLVVDCEVTFRICGEEICHGQ